MISFITGVVVGAGAVAAKDYLSGDAVKASNQKNELDQLYAENEKLRDRLRDADRKVEDLLAEKQKMSNKLREKDDDSDDLSDELDDAKRKIKKLQQQNDELMRKVQEFKTACESYEIEIAQLKSK
jgi:uncharacterized coiled-coil DUF342 family protein